MAFSSPLAHLLLLLNGAAILWLAWWHWEHIIASSSETTWRFLPGRKDQSTIKVALVCPRITTSILKLQTAILSRLNSDRNYRYRVDLFEGHMRNSLTRQHIRMALRKEHAVIVTAGLFTTQIAQEIIAQSKTPKGLVFTNISAQEDHIVQHPTAHTWSTGVLHERDISAEFAHLSSLFEHVSTALILTPKHAFKWLEKDISAVQEHLRDKSVVTTTHQVVSSTTIQPIISKLAGHDLLIVMAHALTHDQFKQIANYCSRSGITLYTNDLDASKNGAAIASGIGQQAIGQSVADKITLIVEHATPAQHIPITTIKPSATVRLNRSVLSDQRVPLSADALFVIGHSQTVSSKHK